MAHAHECGVTAWWTSGRSGIATCDSAVSAIHFSEAEERGGLEGRWTPPQLLLCALAGSFTTTFQALALAEKFDYTDLQVEVDWKVRDGKRGCCFTEIAVHPTLTVTAENQVEEGLALLRRTQALCTISRALSIAQVAEPRVEVGKISGGGWSEEAARPSVSVR